MDRDNSVERWVEERLARLEPPEQWQPDADRAFARLPLVDRAMRKRRFERFVVVGAFAAACIAALLIEAPKAYCAGRACGNQPGGAKQVPIGIKPAPQSEPQPSPTVSRHTAAPPATVPTPKAAPANDFKVSGAPDAPLTCEIYTDYECPACAAAFRDVVPMLQAEYVATGKVRLVHRDFPLPMHAYSRLAARYANAAGRVGEYEVAVAQLFRTQSAWRQTGDIDAELAQVLPPVEMQKIRQLVNGDATLDDSVAADVAMGHEDQITSTPTLIVVKNGKREKISPLPSYELLKTYLDGLLK